MDQKHGNTQPSFTNVEERLKSLDKIRTKQPLCLR